jgi:hypothetical protein
VDEERKFELEEEPERASPPPPPPPRPKAAPAPVSTREGKDASLIGKHRQRRLVRLIPSVAVGFFLVGWLALGVERALVFALAGAGLGALAAWSRPTEVVLGTLGAGLGLLSYLVLVGFSPSFSMLIAIAGCGIVGFLFGIDDRLRGA